MDILQTYNSDLLTLRDEANEDTAILTATANSFSQKPATTRTVNSDKDTSRANGMQIIMCGGSAAEKTFTWLLYGWRRGNGISTLICSGTATLGLMQVVTYPNSVGTTDATAKGATASSKFWADTINVASSPFVKGWSATDSGNDRAAILSGDLAGFVHVYLEILSADGTTGTEAGDVSAFYSGW